MTKLQDIHPGSPVVANVAGRQVAGRVTCAAHRGTTLLGIGFYSTELGHVNRFDDAINVNADDIVCIDIVELTEMFGEPADQQHAIAEWTGDDNIWINGSDDSEPNPRWTRAEAADLLRIWQSEQRNDPLGVKA